MTVLHQRLLDMIEDRHRHLIGCVSCSTCEASALGHALKAAVELHAPTDFPTYGPRGATGKTVVVCCGCVPQDRFDAQPPDWADCPTIRRIAEELGVETP